MFSYLEFEKSLAELEAQIAQLRETSQKGEVSVDIEADLRRLEGKARSQLSSLYSSLSPWQKTQVARHPARPHFRDYVQTICSDFIPLGGDRTFGDDLAILGGLATLGGGRKVVLIGHEKGNDTQSRLRHNFGMGKPEGYRKAVRLMHLAGRFGLPVVTLVDTSGAFPGVEAEERGQAEAIARATQACLNLPVPMVAAIVGEGGSGGAVALASAERVLMFEHAVYSVISPEGCASILWRTAEKAPDAAQAMRVTAQDLKKLNVIDRIVPEPLGGAHRDPKAAAEALGKAIEKELESLALLSADQLQEARASRFLAIDGRS